MDRKHELLWPTTSFGTKLSNRLSIASALEPIVIGLLLTGIGKIRFLEFFFILD
jgi:hypothetical protein